MAETISSLCRQPASRSRSVGATSAGAPSQVRLGAFRSLRASVYDTALPHTARAARLLLIHTLSRAGSGKTAAFGLPLLERLLYRNRRASAIYTLVMTPTRELAVQVCRVCC